MPSDGLDNFNNDFGAGWYNDHHFQYGYFVYAMAAVAKLDQIYLKTYRSAMDSIVRDICNPFGDDTDFPFARHKDLFDVCVQPVRIPMVAVSFILIVFARYYFY